MIAAGSILLTRAVSNMAPDADDRVEPLFHEAVGLPAEQREAFLERTCAGDTALCARVRQLLRDDAEAAKGFLRGGAAIPAAAAAPGTRIGQFTIAGVLGEGGMGTVYESEQDHPRRKVALKLIRPGLMLPPMLRRFTHEAEVLGRLEHPGIARIYHAGVADTPLGKQPYFAMELIRGAPLTQWAQENNPPLRRRLELLIAICHAVQHAHTKGIIHRDLKPSNILITDDGQPKILDFGVARATDSDIATTTLHTAPGEVVGTLPYMAPEQAAGKVNDVDTSSDVYALGVIAFELLSGGRMPYDVKGKPIHEAVSAICDVEPTRLSSINRSLRGDVETIVGKALEKDRMRRYHTAGEFAADVRRYLEYEPIAARRPSTAYQLRKFAGRNRLLVSSTAIIILLLIVGTVTSTVFAIRARRAAATATRLNQSLRQMLASADPNAGNGHDFTVRQMLDDFSAQLGNQLADQPEVEADLQSTIGLAYRRLDDTAKASQHLARAMELRRGVFGEQHEKYVDSMVDFSESLHEQSRHPEAEEHVRKALAIYRARGADDVTMMRALRQLAWHQAAQYKWAEVEATVEQAKSLNARMGAGTSPDLAAMYGWYVQAKLNGGHLAEAEALARESLAWELQLRGRNHPETGWAHHFLGQVLYRQERFTDSLAAFREALAVFRAVYPPDHGHIGWTLGIVVSVPEDAAAVGADLSEMFRTPDELKELDSLCRAGPPVYRPFEGHQHARVTQGSALARVAALYLRLERDYAKNGKPAEARIAHERGEALVDELRGARSPDPEVQSRMLAALIRPLLIMRRRADAEDCARNVLQLAAKNPASLNTAAWELLGEFDANAGDPSLAVELAQRAADLRPDDPAIRNTLGIARYRAGDFKQAATELEMSVQLRKGGGVYDWLFLAMAYQRLGEAAAARRWYDKAVSWLQKNPTRNQEILRYHREAAELMGADAHDAPAAPTTQFIVPSAPGR